MALKIFEVETIPPSQKTGTSKDYLEFADLVNNMKKGTAYKLSIPDITPKRSKARLVYYALKYQKFHPKNPIQLVLRGQDVYVTRI